MQNKRDFERWFRAEILPEIRAMEREFTLNSGQVNKRFTVDRPMRRESWNNLIDAMVKEKELPIHAMDWTCPW
jgi:transposase